MPSKSASLGVAGGSAFLGLLGLVATSREFQHASQVAAEDTEGLVAGFAAFFALSFLLTCLLALGEAGLLTAVVLRSAPPPWGHRLLIAGAVAGGLAIPPRAVLTVWFVTEMSLPSDVLLGAWWLLAAIGLLCSGLGILLHAIGPVNRAQVLSLQGALLVLVVFVTGIALSQLLDGRLWFGVGGIGVLLATLGVFCFGLGALLNPVDLRNRDHGTMSRGLALVPVLGGVAITVVQALAGALFVATAIGLASLVALWAVWPLFSQPQWGEPPEEAG